MRSRHIAVSPHQVVTLMDTPGQEIFYRMRNTGSEVCDGNILVIAINDDVCTPSCEKAFELLIR